MTQPGWDQWLSCDRKHRFETQRAATNALKRSQTSKRAKPATRLYQCRYCDGWHLTSQPQLPDNVLEIAESEEDRQHRLDRKRWRMAIKAREMGL